MPCLSQDKQDPCLDNAMARPAKRQHVMMMCASASSATKPEPADLVAAGAAHTLLAAAGHSPALSGASHSSGGGRCKSQQVSAAAVVLSSVAMSNDTGNMLLLISAAEELHRCGDTAALRQPISEPMFPQAPSLHHSIPCPGDANGSSMHLKSGSGGSRGSRQVSDAAACPQAGGCQGSVAALAAAKGTAQRSLPSARTTSDLQPAADGLPAAAVEQVVLLAAGGGDTMAGKPLLSAADATSRNWQCFCYFSYPPARLPAP